MSLVVLDIFHLLFMSGHFFQRATGEYNLSVLKWGDSRSHHYGSVGQKSFFKIEGVIHEKRVGDVDLVRLRGCAEEELGNHLGSHMLNFLVNIRAPRDLDMTRVGGDKITNESIDPFNILHCIPEEMSPALASCLESDSKCAIDPRTDRKTWPG